MDDGNRAAPVPLAREAPVTQPVADRRLPLAPLAQPLDDPSLCLIGGKAGELAGIDQDTVLVDHLADRKVERLRELAVALVVGRDGHDRAGPVLHQHVVGDVDR